MNLLLLLLIWRWLFDDNDIANGGSHYFYQVNGGEVVYANCHHTHILLHSIKEHMVAMMICV